MRAHYQLDLRNHAGHIVTTRSGHNSVMRTGAELIARLFAGTGTPITHMGVGINDTPETDAFSTAALSNTADGGREPLQGNTEAAILAEAFAIEIDDIRRVVRVRLRGTLPADAAVGTVREAGLISRAGENAVLYNRITFAPITKGDDHELTLFWEISFPYGDLQGIF
jgi:hypothetical protein